MTELSMREIEEVSGGDAVYDAGHYAAQAVKAAIAVAAFIALL